MPDRVLRWLDEIGLGEHAQSFAENDIEFDLLTRLSSEDLKELGLSIGHRRRFFDAVAKLGTSASDGAGSPAPSAPHSKAERRHLTVMFCDLVGSTALSAELDPEDLRDVIHAYQEACRAIIGQYDGFIARYMGDGLLIYFGYPQAHEDDAERAVRTGLGIVSSVSALSPREGLILQTRVGIASGLVVAGDIVGEGASEERAVLGDTPNLAARLQGIAAPDSIVISEHTRRLVEGQFVLDDLGSQSLKGISTPVPAYRVRNESDAPSRFAAKVALGLTPHVGRKKEIDLLTSRWKQAIEGEGQIVQFCAEPGIGKSRSVQVFKERLEGESHTSVFCFCSPYRQNSALYPIINHLERDLDFSGDDGRADRLGKLEAALLALKLPLDSLAPLLAALLSVGDEERYAPLPLSPQELRQKTLAAVLRLFEATASGAPLLIVVEDVHWIDPSTLELLNLLVARVRTCRILLLITFRPEFVSPWTVHAHVTTHTLKRLSRRNCEKIVSSILDRPLPAAVIAQIVSKTDGIPLFVEELTKSVLESGVLDAAGDQHQSPGSLTSLAIPDSLQDSLMARLDRLESVKELGQLAAAIGRIFSHELIAAVSPLSVNDLDSGLNRLVHAGLVYRRGTPPNAEYEFKHALVRDAAYESLLKRHRQRLHGNIADVLAERFPSIAENEPELLAQHYSDAGQHAPALDYWRRAGRRAVERSANTEAVRHLTKALEILVELPDTTERAQWELEMQLNLGTAWMSTKGMGASEVTRAYTQARVLSERVGETTQLFTSTWGLWLNNLQRGQGNTAHEFSGQLLNIAKGQSDAALELQAHHAAWTTTLLRGEAGGCREHSARGLALYDEELHRSHRFSYGGHDPGVCGGVFHGLALWLLGYPNQAEESIKEAVTLGRKLSHPFSSAVGLGFATFIHHFRGEPAAAEAWAKELIAICADSSIPHFLAQGTILYGWAVAEQGRGKEGIDKISEGLENLRATGAKMLAPYFLAIAAESYSRNEEYAKSARALEEAFESADQSGELWWTSELHRLRGRLLMAASKEVVEAEKSFVQALTIARRQQAKSLELRSATALAQLWREQGKRDEATALLSPVCEWFTEGFDTADLTEAKTLLGALH